MDFLLYFNRKDILFDLLFCLEIIFYFVLLFFIYLLYFIIILYFIYLFQTMLLARVINGIIVV